MSDLLPPRVTENVTKRISFTFGSGHHLGDRCRQVSQGVLNVPPSCSSHRSSGIRFPPSLMSTRNRLLPVRSMDGEQVMSA